MLPVRAKQVGQHRAEQFAGAGVLGGSLSSRSSVHTTWSVTSSGISVLVIGELKTARAAGGIGIHVEFGARRGVADSLDAAAHDDAADVVDQVRLAGQGAGDVGQRPEADDRDVAGGGANLVADQLFGRVLAGQLRDGEAAPPRPSGPCRWRPSIYGMSSAAVAAPSRG